MARALDRRLETMERERLGVRDPSRDPERTTGAVIVAPQQPSTTVSPRGMEPSDRPRVVEGSPAATPEAPPTAPTAEQVERDILDTGLFRTTFVNFEFARASLLPLSEQTLDAVATVLVRYPTLQIQIGGHTDNVGTDQTNDALSQARAESVTDYLVARGVARGRLSSVGYGERDPVASNENETGRALNRRVEFVVLDSGESIQR